MIYLLLILLFFTTIYFASRLFFLKRSISHASDELEEISQNLEENRIIKLSIPDRDLERLLKAVNKSLKIIRQTHLEYIKKERQLREQIENISHDLRTPLTAILGYLKMMDSARLLPEDRESLDIVVRKSQTLQNLITQFYELSKVTSDDFQLQLSEVDAARLLRETCLDHYSLLEQKHLDIRMEIPDTAILIYADADSLNRVFSNLLQNIGRYAESELSICTVQPPQANIEANIANIIEIKFSNDVAPSSRIDDPSRLFDRFYMQEKSRNQGGTGLGLTISKSLVEHMGGTLQAAYSEHDGKLFLTFTCAFKFKYKNSPGSF